MKVSEHLIETLAGVGIDTCFLVYGGAIADLVDALPGRMRYVVCQHEQAAGFAAEGYAKAKGVPGLAIVTTGPGGGNMVTPIQNCYYDSTPMIVLAGQVMTSLITPKGSGLRQLGFQETRIVEIVRPITKYAVTLEGPMHAAFCLQTAILQTRGGRPGPVLLDIPADVQRAEMPL
jgi:acetolactate synthase-1/2/3 large subunit